MPSMVLAAALRQAVEAWRGRERRVGRRGVRRGPRVEPDWATVRRQAARRGGLVLVAAHRARRRRPVPVVVLWDVSGSMGEYVPLYLPWLRELARRRAHLRVLAFGPAVEDVTALLRRDLGEVADTLRRMSVFGGGTAIGRAVEVMLEADAVRASSLVIIISDGWEGESPERLARALARLRGRARRLMWLNPLRATPGYRPLQRGMMVAARYMDRVAAGASLAELARLGEAEA
jgi:uncharacterized protein with von Willebrand factor type A (vWA) domain